MGLGFLYLDQITTHTDALWEFFHARPPTWADGAEENIPHPQMLIAPKVADKRTGKESTAQLSTGAGLSPVSARAEPASLAPLLAKLVRNKGNDAPSFTTPPGSIRPQVELRKVQPDSMALGQPVNVELHVVNLGKVPAERVRVVDSLPAPVDILSSTPKAQREARGLVWVIDRLEPGQHREFRYQMVLKPEIGESLQTSASVTYSSTMAASATVTPAKLYVDILGPVTTVVGQWTTFRVVVSNLSAENASGVQVRVDLAEGLRHPQGKGLEQSIGTLAVGETRRLELALLPEQPGPLSNTLWISADGVQATSRLFEVHANPVACPLRLNAPKEQLLHLPCNILCEVHNQGKIPLNNASLRVTMPRGLAFVSANQNGSLDELLHTVTWPLGTMAPDAKVQVELSALASEPGDQVCFATLIGDQGLQVESSCSTKVRGQSLVQVEVVDLHDPIRVGETTMYEARAVNLTTSVLTHLRLQVVIPEALRVVRVEGPVGYNLQPNQVVFDPVAVVAAKADVIYRIHVHGASPGGQQVRLAFTCDQMEQPAQAVEHTLVRE